MSWSHAIAGLVCVAALCLLCPPSPALAQPRDPDAPLTKQRIQRLSSGEAYALAEFYVRAMRKVQQRLERAARAARGGEAACIRHNLDRVSRRVVKAARWQRKMWRAIRALDRERAMRLFTKVAHARQRVLAYGWASKLCEQGQRVPVGPDEEVRGCVLPAEIDLPERVPRMPALYSDSVFAHGTGAGLSPRWSLPGGQRLRLHLGGAFEQGYDSNPLHCGDDRDCSGAEYSRMMAHLDLRTEPTEGSAPFYSVRLRGAVANRHYFAGADAAEARAADLEAEADLLLELFPHETLSVALSDRFVRHNQRWSGGPEPRQVNRAGLYLMWIPGGEAVELTGSYTFGLELLDGPGGESADRTYHEAALTARWWFFDRTSLVVDASVQVRHQGDEAAPRSGLVFTPFTPLRLLAGLDGLLTRRLHVTALVGYGNGFHDTGETFSGPLARVEAAWIFGSLRNPDPVSRVYLGYERSFADTLFSAVAARHEVRAGYERFPNHGLQVYAQARWRHTDFAGFATDVSQGELENHALLLHLSLGYKVDGWIFFAAGYQLELRDTLNHGGAGIFAVYAGGYQRHQIFGRIACSY